MCQGQCNCNHKTTDIKDIIEATNDLIRAAKHVVACWEKGDLAEAVTNLDMTTGWAECALKDSGMKTVQHTLTGHKKVTKQLAINEAISLFEDTEEGENPEYLRGMSELIAYCFPREQEPSEEAETIKGMILEQRRMTAESAHEAYPFNLIINVSGGVVQDITSDTPEAFKNVKIALVDYDWNGSDPHDDRIGISCDKEGGNLEPAYMAEMKVEQTSLDTNSIFGFLDGTNYGSGQCGLAAEAEYPCTGCKDINQDGENCVNEGKCLAWRLYNER